ncbi:heavy metal translocating P-type ATPase [Brucepastera parasyntrophica]|uniref:heavy metal translocating P-type ATPase n=1 Tax=Brucepastera parasyntrophica TaxID=2880008 RepID=UPI00210A5686|nr:heavy metal translocating P-type ATPase [Brucepastera parasyntrophica]ULQ60766.1 heavy metal translocating P-type ATPase [Brucepastera parasyntrophica]
MSCSCTNHSACSAVRGKPEKKEKRGEGKKLAIRFTSAAVLFAVGVVLSYFTGKGSLPAFTVYPVRILFVLAWFISGYQVLFSAVRNIRHGKVFDENFLMTIATIGAFCIGEWTEGAAVMLFFNLGEMVQEFAVSRSRRSITDLMDMRPDSARIADSGEIVHPSSLEAGTLIRVLPGEKVPLDGVIAEGISSFDTSGLTGESLPREAREGDEALAGFVNGHGVLVIRTTALYAETVASKMLDLIENAQNRKAKSEKLITSFARIYTPIVVACAVLLAVIPPLLAPYSNGLIVPGFQTWISRALVFLVISCPCAFVISVPLGYFGGIGGAARQGILVKGADYIDTLAKARAVVFDKTGTLTSGRFTVQSVNPAEGFPESLLTELAAAAEFHSTHPLGLAITAYAGEKGTEISKEDIASYTEKAGFGVELLYKGKALIAGSRKYMEENGVRTGAGRPEGGSAVEFAYDGKYAGYVSLSDTPKPEAAGAVAALKKLGINEIVMISGDTEAAASDAAARIGIETYHAGVLPDRKVSLFEEISDRVKAGDEKASVLFVGDGVNDAPVIARADAGIAMGAIGSDAAIEAADVVLMNDNPGLVPQAIKSARWTRHIVAQNIVLSFVVKVGFLVLGAMGIVGLQLAVFADVGVALLAALNALRARKIP